MPTALGVAGGFGSPEQVRPSQDPNQPRLWSSVRSRAALEGSALRVRRRLWQAEAMFRPWER